MLKATYKKHILEFKQPSGTSRGILRTKETWFIKIQEGSNIGYGECGVFKGLSADDVLDYEDNLKFVCDNINLGLEKLLEKTTKLPSIQFGLEQAFLSLKNKNPFLFYPSKFTEAQEGIKINGLIWMGDKDFMKSQIKEKLKQGFSCIKMKIGAIDFDTELALLKSIRKEFSEKEVELRVDANGAFKPKEALAKLEQLAKLNLHSIEQPIKQGQLQEMAFLCKETPLPIALDEELIGVFLKKEKQELLQTVKPQYIILKPTLVGGYSGSKEWIDIAEDHNINWWITSALESNIGLNAIAQWTYILQNEMPQGLGTGGLFTNNIQSPLEVMGDKLYYNSNKTWQDVILD